MRVRPSAAGSNVHGRRGRSSLTCWGTEGTNAVSGWARGKIFRDFQMLATCRLFNDFNRRFWLFFNYNDCFETGKEAVGDKTLIIWYLDESSNGKTSDIKGSRELVPFQRVDTDWIIIAWSEAVVENFVAWIEEKAPRKVETHSFVWDLAIYKALKDKYSIGTLLNGTFGPKVWLRDNPGGVGSCMSILFTLLKGFADPIHDTNTARTLRLGLKSLLI